jgi:hypothetical protein
MSIRKVNRRRLKKIAIGDMREIITIWERNNQAPIGDDISILMPLTNPISEWAHISTVDTISGGQDRFDGVDLKEIGNSHVFTIRYNENYTAENIIEYANNLYEILKTNNSENRNEYLEFFVRIKGDEDLPVNQ